jgi:flagellar hook-length control protein FliK
MQLLLLAAGASPAGAPGSPAGAPGSPAAAGSDGSGFGAVLGELLGDKTAGVPVEATAAMASASTAQGTQALQGAAPTAAEEAAENAGMPDGGAAAPAGVPPTVPAYVPDFGQILLSAPVLMPVAVPVPDDTPMTGAATAGPPDAESAGSLMTSAAATADVATPDDVPGETTPTASSALTANPGAATAAGPASAASPSVPAGPGSATLVAITTPAVSTTAAASSIPTSAATLAPEAGPALGASPAPEASQVPATASAALAPVLPAPLQGLPAVQPNTPAPAAAPLPDPGRLTPQLAGPLFLLASAAPGQHVMTLKVSPEDLGPLTVRAHIDATGVRIELFAPGDAGRDALRTILPELRRGLAESGLGASLDLSDHGAPADGGAGEPGQDRRAPQGSQPLLASAATAEPARPGRLRAAVVLPGTTPAVLDILV